MLGRPNIKKLRARGDVTGLGKLLSHDDPVVRREAVVALAATTDEEKAALAVEFLLRALQDPDEAVRVNAEVALDQPESPAIRRALIRRRRAQSRSPDVPDLP